jgi:hypothetical protein
VCVFKQEGDKLSGTCGSPDKFPISGRVQSNKLNWQLDVEHSMRIPKHYPTFQDYSDVRAGLCD